MKIQVLVITLFILLLSPFAFAQNLNGVQLNDGTLIYGDIYGSSQTSKWINIKKKDGSIETIKRDDVLKFLNNESAEGISDFTGSNTAKTSNAMNTKFYLGAGYGFSSMDTGITTTGTATIDEDDNGFKVFGGVKLNDFFGFEFGYADLGTAEIKGNTGDTITSDGVTITSPVDNVTIEADFTTVIFESILFLPLDKISGNESLKYFEPFLKLGVCFWDAEATLSVASLGLVSVDDDGTDIIFGGGINFNINENLTVRAEWERFSTDEDIDYFSGSVVFNF